MTGKETVEYLKAKYTEGQDYAHVTVIVRKREVQVHSPSEAMQVELKEMGFEINGWWATKVWPEVKEVNTEVAQQETVPQLFINQYTGMIKLNGLTVIGQGKFNEDTNQYEIPTDFQIPEWVK